MGGILVKRDLSFAVLDEETSDALLGTCDGLHDPQQKRVGFPKVYPAKLPQDVLLRLMLHGFLVSAGATLLFAFPWILDSESVPHQITQQGGRSSWLMEAVGLTCIGGVLWFLLLLAHIPKTVIRQADSLVFEFLIHTQTVKLTDILELVVLRSGSQFRQLLGRWGVFPHGRTFRFFFGARSRQEPVCVLLTRRFFWSFVFSLEDPVQFLLDSQRPLDSTATYRTTRKAILRESMDIDSSRLGAVPKGSVLQVEEQRGRRVLVQVENSELRGWISYFTTKGFSLLTKERDTVDPVAGVVGASELATEERDSLWSMEMGLQPERLAGGEE